MIAKSRLRWIPLAIAFGSCILLFLLYLENSKSSVLYEQSDLLPLLTNSDDDSESAYYVSGIVYPNSSTKLLLQVPGEKFALTRHLNGAFFETTTGSTDEGDRIWLNMTTKVGKFFIGRHVITTTLLHSFSPQVERRVANMFPDAPKENVYFANSPALLWDHDYNNGTGRLIVIMRIWLERERYEIGDIPFPKNHFLDNYFYAQSFDKNMQPLDPGHIMGIPTSGGSNIGDGAIEPRIFAAFKRSNIFVSFNTGTYSEKKSFIDYTLIWDYNANNVKFPKINSPNPMFLKREKVCRDKHWMAFTLPPSYSKRNNDKLYVHFVHNLDPLRILECDSEFACKIAFQVGSLTDNAFDDKAIHLRGGTPFVLYKWPYYISVAHVTLFKNPSWSRFYTGNFVVLRADPTSRPPYRIVYVSYPIHVDESLLASVPIVRYDYIKDTFIFPVGLIVENLDTAILGVHINDHSAMMFRIRGLESIMNDVIRLDSPDGSNVNNEDETLIDIANMNKGTIINPNEFTRFAASEESGFQFKF